ncbi:hypothetical protein SAMN05216345_101873 [Cupriavidus sp. YR651]|nr:hypothetical protein [Cupriavidus sp. YR651]SDC19336.1 hypothetical protein SAMN05216345_101873 [Cupriavidus sp. YR651]
MIELDDRFAKLLRKQPTEADRQNMYRCSAPVTAGNLPELG